MWILKENNEKATAGKNCFSKDNSIEKTQFAVMDSYNANCRCVFVGFFVTFTVDFIRFIHLSLSVCRTRIEGICLQELNFNCRLSYKQSKSFFSDTASCKSSVQFHLICLYHESQKQLEAIYGI